MPHRKIAKDAAGFIRAEQSDQGQGTLLALANIGRKRESILRYYVISDPHGFYTETRDALKKAGFFDDPDPHKLIVCGDLMDRGAEAEKMQTFMEELLDKEMLIFVRGNHEDLMQIMLDDILDDFTPFLGLRSYHVRNGTLDTAAQLNKFTLGEFLSDPASFVSKTKESVFYRKLIPSAVNYYETKNYVFVHGWIPCIRSDHRNVLTRYKYIPVIDWRSASEEAWKEARWTNGMEAAEFGKITEDGKTIVCGHWHASYGHAVVQGKCPEHGDKAIYDTYFGNGVIGLDACTAITRKVNCIVIEDDPL